MTKGYILWNKDYFRLELDPDFLGYKRFRTDFPGFNGSDLEFKMWWFMVWNLIFYKKSKLATMTIIFKTGGLAYLMRVKVMQVSTFAQIATKLTLSENVRSKPPFKLS